MPEGTDFWKARLNLGFAARPAGRTVLEVRSHHGPIMVQRALYPEGNQVCHVTILHPPAGIAGGDVIDINVGVGQMAQATLTTPGATRWYRSNRRQALQTAHVTVAQGGRIDWLPMENLFFEETNAVSCTDIELESGAAAIGWDISQLGRVTKAACWKQGSVRTETSLKIDGKLLWKERGLLDASADARWSVCGLAGFPVFGSLWCFGDRLSAEQVEALANLMPWSGNIRGGATMITYDARQSLCLVRGVSVHVEDMMSLMRKVWSLLRLWVLHTEAMPLRLWAT
jgi:urease accessory protein